MAMVVLPVAADLLQVYDSNFAQELRSFSESLRQPVLSTITKRWFGRAWVRNSLDESYLLGNDQVNDTFQANFIDLEAQPWFEILYFYLST